MDQIVDLFQEFRQEFKQDKQIHDLYNSPKMREKILATDYLLGEIIKWYEEETGIKITEEQYFNRQKAMKLIFFVASGPREDGTDLLDIFDKWHAMAWGPTEADVWDFFRLDLLPRYRITDKIEIK